MRFPINSVFSKAAQCLGFSWCLFFQYSCGSEVPALGTSDGGQRGVTDAAAIHSDAATPASGERTDASDVSASADSGTDKPSFPDAALDAGETVADAGAPSLVDGGSEVDASVLTDSGSLIDSGVAEDAGSELSQCEATCASSRCVEQAGQAPQCLCAAEKELSVYHIGNSLTWDSQPHTVAAYAALSGENYSPAFHIKCNSALNDIVANPDVTCVEPVAPYGNFETALSGYEWDAVTMQPFHASGSTLGSDTEAILELVDLTRSNPANRDTRFYLYTGWPHSIDLDGWAVPRTYELDSRVEIARDYFDALLVELRSRSDAEFHIVPVGELMYQLGQLAEQGAVPEHMNGSSFYRDAIHASVGTGRYSMAMMTWATMLNRNPMGTRFAGEQYSDELYNVMHETIWSVLNDDPNTGISSEASCWWE